MTEGGEKSEIGQKIFSNYLTEQINKTFNTVI